MIVLGRRCIAQTRSQINQFHRGKIKRTLTVWITLVTLLLALAIPVSHAALAEPAPSQHPEYRAAATDLQNARKHLKNAKNDGKGHRD